MDKSYWLFHFRLAGEKVTNSKVNAHGIGHAMRCLSIIHEIETNHNKRALIVSNAGKDVDKFFASKGRVFFSEEDIDKVFNKYDVEIIVSDINYLEQEFIEEYENHCPWACLAPRGDTKYQSSLSFKDSFFDDNIPPKNLNKMFSGVDYIVTRPTYPLIKEQLSNNQITKDHRKLIVSMGGVDHQNLTYKVLQSLSVLDPSWKIEVILGPLYEHEDEIIDYSKDHPCNINITKDPVDIYLNLAKSGLGIFAAGVVSYESAGLGTPCLNISMSDFHSKRCQEIEDLGFGINLGNISSLPDSLIGHKIESLTKDIYSLEKMRAKGIQFVDGKGSFRIVKELKKYLELYS